jgi:hypothetical protein
VRDERNLSTLAVAHLRFTGTCPRCKAGPGEYCRSPNGKAAASPHRERVVAATGLSARELKPTIKASRRQDITSTLIEEDHMIHAYDRAQEVTLCGHDATPRESVAMENYPPTCSTCLFRDPRRKMKPSSVRHDG